MEETKDKISKLKKLQERIKDTFGKDEISEKENYWFFPEGDKFGVPGVKGYNGTMRIMFVGLNPSTGDNKAKKVGHSEADHFLYSELKKQGFEDAHLTDFSKKVMKNKEVGNHFSNELNLKIDIEFLKEEIETINPKIIVAMGRKCEKLFKELNYKPEYIWHYSYVFRGKKKEQEKNKEYSEQMKCIKERYDKID